MNRHQAQSPGKASGKPRAAGWAVLAWFVAGLAVNWLGNWNHSLWDRDEPRYAVATREMIAGGDWIVPYFNGDYRFDKPILVYWLMSVPMRLMGVNAFSARAASGVAGSVAVALVFLLALRMGAGRGGAHVAALLTLLSPLMLVVSKAATTDAMLVLTVVAALFLHWEQRARGFSWIRHAAFWLVVAASALQKGPPGLLVITSAVVGERIWRAIAGRRMRRGMADPSANPQGAETVSGLPAESAPGKPRDEIRVAASTAPGVARSVFRSVLGLVLFLAATIPWAWAAWVRTEGQFFEVAVGRHVLERAGKALESHGGPILYYIPVILGGFLPFTAAVLCGMRWGWRERRRDALRLLWMWIVPPFVVFSLAGTKLPHYVSPLAPALALMTGLWWSAFVSKKSAGLPGGSANSDLEDDDPAPADPAVGWWRAGAIFTAVFALAGGIALPVVVFITPFPPVLLPSIVIGAALLIGGLFGARLWWRRRAKPALTAWTAGFLVAFAAGLLWGLPRLEPYRPAPQLAQWVRENAPPGTELMAVDYQEPSLVFYWKDYVTMKGKNEEEEGLARMRDLTRPLALVTTEDRWRKWIERYDAPVPLPIGARFEKRFYLFQKGRWQRLVIAGNWDVEPLEEVSTGPTE